MSEDRTVIIRHKGKVTRWTPDRPRRRFARQILRLLIVLSPAYCTIAGLLARWLLGR